MGARKPFIILVLITLLLGCDEPFEPKGPFKDQVVVFAILTTLKDTQFVRLYRTYDPPEFDPLEVTTDNAIVGAQVSVSGSASNYQFRDTSIARIDKSRYANDIAAYVAHPFVVERGETYRLNVSTGTGEQMVAEVNVPRPATITVSNSLGFRNPIPFRDEFFGLSCALSTYTFGFEIHAYIEYDLLENGVYVPKRKEIPVAVRDRIDCLNYQPEFHQLQRRKAVQPELVTFDVLAYMVTLSNIWATQDPFNVRMRQVVFEVTEFDPALYKYLNIVNGFRDAFSIRTDEPDYTNISGGLGIFGVMTQQSITFALSDTTGKSLLCNRL